MYNNSYMVGTHVQYFLLGAYTCTIIPTWYVRMYNNSYLVRTHVQ